MNSDKQNTYTSIERGERKGGRVEPGAGKGGEEGHSLAGVEQDQVSGDATWLSRTCINTNIHHIYHSEAP